MNWHETIQVIRKDPKYKELVSLAYFDSDLQLNVTKFGESDEFLRTLEILKTYAPEAKTLLDIGAGNGISAINFALKGFDVTAVEPDPSDSIGANAIRILKERLLLHNLIVYENFAEDIGFEDNSFDVVYIRQAMHHANDLTKFLAESARVLKPGGLLLTVRDHVVYDEKDKQWFLNSHPLHKFYGGENAFRAEEYESAMELAGLTIVKVLKFCDSVINYFPLTEQDIRSLPQKMTDRLREELKKKVGVLSRFPFIFFLYKLKNGSIASADIERHFPGRMYSYIAKKNT
jgi:ubiquinone/menaquinone biosynthesis C-methylase UbiE